VLNNKIGIDILGNLASIHYCRLINSNDKWDSYFTLATNPLSVLFWNGRKINFGVGLQTNYKIRPSLYLFNETGGAFLPVYFPVYIINTAKTNESVQSSRFTGVLGFWGITSSFGFILKKNKLEFLPILPTFMFVNSIEEEMSFEKKMGISLGSKMYFKF
jgi:hypothetical protein